MKLYRALALTLFLGTTLAANSHAQLTMESVAAHKRAPERLQPAADRLLAEADAALLIKPVAIADTTQHNFAPSDQAAWQVAHESIVALSAAFALTRKPVYAEHAVRFLRTWFLDPKTRMKPNLDQGPILAFRNLPTLLEALKLLDMAAAWTEDDRFDMRDWLVAYNTWLATSPRAKQEAACDDQRGCWFDVQATALAIHLSRDDEARKIATRFKTKRIGVQVLPDGRLPQELSQSDSWSSATLGVEALFTEAELAARVGVDLWAYKSPDGRSIKGALDYLLPFLDGKPWPHASTATPAVDPAKLVPALLRAPRGLFDPTYRAALERLPKPLWESRRERFGRV